MASFPNSFLLHYVVPALLKPTTQHYTSAYIPAFHERPKAPTPNLKREAIHAGDLQTAEAQVWAVVGGACTKIFGFGS